MSYIVRIITGFDAEDKYVELNADFQNAGSYTLKIRYASPWGDKKCDLYINDIFQGKVDLSETSSFVNQEAGQYDFNTGVNSIKIQNGWGYYDIDCIIIE